MDWLIERIKKIELFTLIHFKYEYHTNNKRIFIYHMFTIFENVFDVVIMLKRCLKISTCGVRIPHIFLLLADDSFA
jgi:hypothetical protein